MRKATNTELPRVVNVSVKRQGLRIEEKLHQTIIEFEVLNLVFFLVPSTLPS
jgi:hypothetical protein